MAPTNRVRAIAANGDGLVSAVNRFFRQGETTEDAPLPRNVTTLQGVTRGLGLEQGVDAQIQRIVGGQNPTFTQKTQTQRIFLAQSALIDMLRVLPDLDSGQRLEITKRARAYWKHHYQTDYFKAPTVRYVAHKSEPTLVIKAHARVTLPQIPKAKLSAFLDSITAKAVHKTVDPETLTPIQDKVDDAKIKRMKADPKVLKQPIVVSADNYVIDGHHRWVACKALGQKIPIIQVALRKTALLEQARDFDGAEFKKAEQLGLDFGGSAPKSGPPPGYTAVPKSAHGGYRKKVGRKYVYWYPEGKAPARKPRKKKGPKRADVWGNLTVEAVDQWRKDAAVFVKAHKALSDRATEEQDSQPGVQIAPSPAFTRDFRKLEDAMAVFSTQLANWGEKHVAGTSKAMTVMKRIKASFEDIPGTGTLFSYGFHQDSKSDSRPEPEISSMAYPGSFGEYRRNDWKKAVQKALDDVEAYVRDESYSNERLRPTETLVRGKVQFVIYAGGFIPKDGEGESTRLNGNVRDTLRNAEELQKKLNRIGLGKATEGLTVHVHGESRIEAEGSEHRQGFVTAGYYNTRKDFVRMFPCDRPLHTLTHELGHRVYFQQMSPEGRQSWERFYESRKTHVVGRDVALMIDILSRYPISNEDADRLNLPRGLIDFAQAQEAVNRIAAEDPKVGPRLQLLAEQMGTVMDHHPTKKQHFTADDWAKAYKIAYEEGLRGDGDGIRLQATEEFVSDYAETNAGELFAEAFDKYVREGRAALEPRIRDQIERALKSTGMPLKKSEAEPTLTAPLRKAEGAPKAGHKYIKRVPYMKDGKRKYRYYYRESAAARDVKEGETVRLGKKLIEILKVGKDGKVTLKMGGKTQTVSPEQWNTLMARHYGQRYLDWSEKRASQTVQAVLRHVPKELLQDLKGSDKQRLKQLEKRVPEVYAKLQQSFQRSGISPFRAKSVLGTVLERRGWEPEARAAVIGQVLEDRTTPYRQTVQAAENLAAGDKVKAAHVQAVSEMIRPHGGGDPKAALTELAERAEKELAVLSAALAKAKGQGSVEALQAALNSPAMAQLAMTAQALPGLKDKAVAPVRDALLQVAPTASKPKREGAESVVYVSGENGAPRALKARYKLVEAGEAVASHKPGTFSKRDDYPSGVQERAYHRDKDEQAKVLRNAHKLNPAFLINTNPDAVNGPPIVDQNGVVLGGNSRTMSMQLAYDKHPDKAKEMKAYLAKHAHEVGLTEADVGAMKNPILVRVVESADKADQKLLVRQMNESFTQGMDPRTMQVALGRKLDEGALKELGDSMNADETLGAFLDTPRAAGFINALTRTGIIDQRNSNQYMVKNTKRLNEDGKQLVERVLVGRTVGDADLLSNTGSKLISHIARSVPFLAQAKAYGQTYDLGDDLKVALESYNDLNYRAQQGHRSALSADMSDKEFQGLFAQDEMFGEKNPILENKRAMTMLEVLIRKNGPTKMANVFREYAAKAAQHPEDQEAMFGDKPKPEALLAEAMKGDTKKSMEPVLIVKAANPVYIGKRGGRWADPLHKIPWKERTGRRRGRLQSGVRKIAKPQTAASEDAKKAPALRHWVKGAEYGLQETHQQHKGPDGKYTAERKKLHEKIHATFLDHVPTVPENQKPTAIVTMGGPASGKTTLVHYVLGSFADFAVVNPDDVKEELPEYKKGINLGQKDGVTVAARDAAFLVHQESSEIAQEIQRLAIEQRKNIILDGTGKNVKKYQQKIQALKDAGYHVQVIMPHVEMDEAVRRVEERANKTGRYVPEDIVRHAHTRIPANFEAIARMGDGFALFKTGRPPTEVWSGGADREDTIHDAGYVRDFLQLGKRLKQEVAAGMHKADKGEKPPSVSIDDLLNRVANTKLPEKEAEPIQGGDGDGIWWPVADYEDDVRERMDKKGSMKKSTGPTLVVKARGSTFATHIPIAPQSGASPRFHTPPIPDFQSIYMQPESSEKDKRDQEQRETRRRATAERNRGKYGFHGTKLPLKPALRWGDVDSGISSEAIHDPDQPGKRAPRKSPKLVARIKAGSPEADKLEAQKKRKRKKKKKQAKLVAGER